MSLIEACELKDINGIRMLIEEGVDIHADGDLALIIAANHKDTKILRLLITAGADIRINQDYLIRSASYHGRYETVKCLIAAGADIHADDDTAVRYAWINDHTETVELLVDASMYDEIRYSYNRNLYIFNNPILNNINTHSIPVWCSDVNNADNSYIIASIASFQKKKSAI